MTKVELITAIGNTLTQLDNALADFALVNQPAKWQQAYAMRNHLDQQQRELLVATIQSDDEDFQTLTGKIQAATKQLQQTIEDLKKIDSIIDTIGEISADLDAILKTVA